MRARIVRPGEMRDIYGAEVKGFDYAFVMPGHGAGWENHSLVPAAPDTPAAADAPRRRAGDKKPVYIEIKPKA